MNDYCNAVLNAAFKANELSNKERQVIEQGYNNGTRDGVYNISKSKKILPFIGMLMCSLNLDFQFWDEIVSRYKKRNQYMLEVLTRLFGSFKKQGVKKIFVYENFGALLLSGSGIELFASGDIDLYAYPAEREKIEKALGENGFYIKRASESRELVASRYYNDSLTEQFYISIMWQPLSRSRLPFYMDIDYCIDWEELIKYKDTDITLPSPEALMYLCILHISVHGYSRNPDIRLYADIYNVSKRCPNWERVIEFAKHDDRLVRVITVCIISKDLLGIDIPDIVFDYKRKYGKKIDKLLEIVYDKGRNTLNHNLSAIDIMKIETYSDNHNLIGGIFKILFPASKWIKAYYLKGKGNLIIGYVKHLKNLFFNKEGVL